LGAIAFYLRSEHLELETRFGQKFVNTPKSQGASTSQKIAICQNSDRQEIGQPELAKVRMKNSLLY